MVLYNNINFRHDKISFAIATVDMACSEEQEVGSWPAYVWDRLDGAAPQGL